VARRGHWQRGVDRRQAQVAPVSDLTTPVKGMIWWTFLCLLFMIEEMKIQGLRERVSTWGLVLFFWSGL
jgi:hypothetical protein